MDADGSWLGVRTPAMESMFEMLRGLAAREASGEIVAAGDDLEVHVYFHRGRVAWGTSSSEPSAFLSYLVQTYGVDADGLREVIEECRRTRQRFGETLVDWGLATTDQVRDALRHQIAGAVRALAAIRPSDALFLNKALAYSDELTFDLSDVLPEDEAPPAAAAEDAELVGQLLRSAPDVIWAAVEPGGLLQGPYESRGRAARGLFPRLQETLEDASEAVLRCVSGAILARPTGRGGWLMAAVPAGVGLGLPTAVMAHLLGATPRPRRAPATGGALTRHASPALEPLLDPMEQVMATTDDLTSAFVLQGDAQGGVARGQSGFDGAVAVGRGLAEILELPLSTCFDAVGTKPLRYERVSVHVLRGGTHYFGIGLQRQPGATLWLALGGDTSPGMGWALLTAVARQLDEVEVTR